MIKILKKSPRIVILGFLIIQLLLLIDPVSADEVFGVFAEANLSSTFGEELDFMGIPVSYYENDKLFDSDTIFDVSFAGIYANINFTIPENDVFPISLGFSLEGLALGFEQVLYKNGEPSSWSIASPFFSLGLGFSKTLGENISISTNHELVFRDYEKSGAVIVPENNSTYYADIVIEFQINPNPFRSITALSLNPGLSLTVSPGLVYQLDFQPWGETGDLFTHDSFPGYKAQYAANFSFMLGDYIGVSNDLAYYQGVNVYTLDQWSFGQDSLIQGGARLVGYFQDEFLSQNALLNNLNIKFLVDPNSFGVILKHDILYHGESNQFFQGTGLELVFSLANWEISLEGAVAWNSARQNGIGWSSSLLIRFLSF
jgi:hypothetical protein